MKKAIENITNFTFAALGFTIAVLAGSTVIVALFKVLTKMIGA